MRGIYLHFPFCVRKCFYCDFYSEENLKLSGWFVDSLCEEIRLYSELEQNIDKNVDTVFIGGGTPSLLKPAELARIIEQLNKYFNINTNAEWTLECNPGTMLRKNAKEYLNLGINRLSIGVQSFVNSELNFLQRIHNAEEAEKSYNMAREAGFENISLDLIFSIPGQNENSWRHTLDKAISLQPDHISAYSLIFEPGTPLYNEWMHGNIRKNDDENDASLYEMTINTLTDAGFEQYEVSNFARNGKKSRHNLNYWYGGEYFAFGPSAHGYINGKRYRIIDNLREYLDLIYKDELPIAGSEEISGSDEIIEKAFLGLRAEGIDYLSFKEKYNIDLLKVLAKDLNYWLESGLIILNDGKISLTPAGYMVCDELTVKLISRLEDLNC